MPEHTGCPETAEHVHRDRDDESPLVTFSPDAIREHFEGTGREERSSRLSDQTLRETADHVLLTKDWFWAVFDQVCVEVLETAEEQLCARREKQP